MVSFARKLTRLLPAAPRKRYNIFAGTNTLSEWRQMACAWLSGGLHDAPDIINEYERRFAKCCGVKHGISFGAGRMALYAVLEALDIGQGDEVILPAFTCVVVPNAILYRGARPVYVDIKPRYFSIDVRKVEAAITPRTKALYAQHAFGVPCDVEALRDIGRRHGLPVIEDAAHALGAVYRGKPVGSLTEVAFFSTDHSKVINTHLGGMAVTDNDALAARLRRVQAEAPFLDTNLTRRLIRSFLLEYFLFAPRVLWLGRTMHTVLARLDFLFYFFDELKTTKPTEYPYPCRLSSAQAQLGLSQLENLQGNLAHRRQIANWLEQKIRWNGMSSDQIDESTWLRYSFLVKDRAKFQRCFSKHFDLGIWFTSVVEGRMKDLEEVGYHPGSCPVAEYVVQHIVNLPTHLRIPLEVIQKEVDRNWGRVGHDILYESIG
jgi:dTDP-4-amino-4,6-dideoxygalactose transaminase